MHLGCSLNTLRELGFEIMEVVRKGRETQWFCHAVSCLLYSPNHCNYQPTSLINHKLILCNCHFGLSFTVDLSELIMVSWLEIQYANSSEKMSRTNMLRQGSVVSTIIVSKIVFHIAFSINDFS